jgi:hypothetical protein
LKTKGYMVFYCPFPILNNNLNLYNHHFMRYYPFFSHFIC